MEYEKVVDILGTDKVIGISTHSEAQTIEACKKEPDYIGIGPVYKTPTKKIPDPVIGIEGMKNMLKESQVPAVCIGGITLPLLSEVLEGGAKNFSMVRPLCSAKNPAAVIKNILKIYTDFHKGH
jgi:thiamine-phosphate pyrophosphorylase